MKIYNFRKFINAIRSIFNSIKVFNNTGKLYFNEIREQIHDEYTKSKIQKNEFCCFYYSGYN